MSFAPRHPQDEAFEFAIAYVEVFPGRARIYSELGSQKVSYIYASMLPPTRRGHSAAHIKITRGSTFHIADRHCDHGEATFGETLRRYDDERGTVFAVDAVRNRRATFVPVFVRTPEASAVASLRADDFSVRRAASRHGVFVVRSASENLLFPKMSEYKLSLLRYSRPIRAERRCVSAASLEAAEACDQLDAGRANGVCRKEKD